MQTNEQSKHQTHDPVLSFFNRVITSAALAAADEATQAWQSEAEAHFRKISDESFIAFPSGRNKILGDFSDPDQLMLVIRVACPSHLRLKVEQAVFRDTWRTLKTGQSAGLHS